ncbi:MAG: hypothetical protein KIT22_04045 [Verrucomicrobiae bacterium]|nr:hypothetical protein [Verrucomicrobiae bacterium]
MSLRLRRYFLWAASLLGLAFLGYLPCRGADSIRVARWSVTTNGVISAQSAGSPSSVNLFEGSPLTNILVVDANSVSHSFAAGAPEARVTYAVDRWGVPQGLPSDRIQALHQSREGYLWVGTRNGLGRFDGDRWVVFNAANTPILQKLGDYIRSLANDAEGILWVATGHGLIRIKDGDFIEVPEVTWDSVGRIHRIATRRASGLWIGTEAGLWLYHDTELRRVGEAGQVLAVMEEADGAVVACFPERVARMDPRPETWTEIYRNHPTNPLFQFGPGCELVLDENGQSILVSHSGALRETTNPGGWEWIARPVDLAGADWRSVQSPFATRAGARLFLAAGSDRSLSVWSDGKRLPLPLTDGQSIDQVTCLLTDRGGATWVGTAAAGLIRLRPQPISALCIAKSGGHASILSVCEGADSSIWCGTRIGVQQWGNHELRLFDFDADPLFFEAVNSLHRTASGEIWGTFGSRGLLQFATSPDAPDSQMPRRFDPGARAFEQVGPARSLYETRSKTLWMGTKEGLFRGGPDPGLFTSRHGLPHNDVRALHQDREGRLWIGTFGGGLSRMRSESASLDSTNAFENFDHQQGLSHGRVWAIHEDEEGVLWLGTAAGLNRFRDGRFFSFAQADGMIHTELNHILEDGQGRLWLSSNHGIVRVERKALNAFADGRIQRLPVYHYGIADGMPDDETNGEQQPSGCRANDGRLYFASQRGLVMIDPRELPPDAPAPSLRIEEVKADGDVVYASGQVRGVARAEDASAAQDSLTLPPGTTESLEIRFTAISISVAEPVQIEYRLDGLETAWRRAGSDRVAAYINLKPRTYRFLLRAADAHGVHSEWDRGFVFTIQPHFWQTLPFYAVCGAVMIGAIGTLHAYRIRRQQQRLELQRTQALHQERSRIARDLHDQLGAKLSKLALNTGSPQTRQEGVRETLRELKEVIWLVNPRNDSLDGLATFLGDAAREYLAAGKIRLDLDLPASLPDLQIPSDTRHHLAAAFHETLRNVVQHSGASAATVSLRTDRAFLWLEVADDGRGFNPAGVSKTGSGLSNLRDRLAELKGECRVQSHPGAGTRVQLKIPLPDA